VAELRRHPVWDQWVVVCPERTELEACAGSTDCLYCPGREGETGKEIYRIGGGGPQGWKVRVVAETPPLFRIEGDFCKMAAGVCDRMAAIGAHEIVIEGPDHRIRAEDIDAGQFAAVLEALRTRFTDLSKDSRLRHVVAFKAQSKQDAGSHPRWHIIATPFVPANIKVQLRGCEKYYAYRERCAFCDYLGQEVAARTRVICENDSMVAVSPYAARFPYEIWVLPARHSADFREITPAELSGLGAILKRLIGAVERLPQASGYVVSIHTAPFRTSRPGGWKTLPQDYHWHVEVKPAVGILNGLKDSGFYLNPVPPEEAARVLAELC
jgi:UDPglucose--hexose-1-phosphate uridylyltransferase